MGKKTGILGVLLLMIMVSNPLVFGTGKNLLKNPSFEKTGYGNPSAWEIGSNDLQATKFAAEQGPGHSGQRFATIINHTPNDSRYWQWVPVNELKKYKLTAWVKTENVGITQRGAYIAINGTTSGNITGTNRQWELLDLYLETGKGVYLVTTAFGLGGFESLNTGKASFDDFRMEEVDTIPADSIIAIIEFEDNTNQAIKPSWLSPSIFNYGFMIWLFMILITIGILIYKDPAGRRGLYLSGLTYLLLAGILVIFFGIYMAAYTSLSTPAVQLFFIAILVSAGGYVLYLRKTEKWKSDNVVIILIILGIAVRICYYLYTGYEARQHDVPGCWGHEDYIKYIAGNWSMPPLGDYQLYHPPIHHLFAAIGFAFGKVLGFDEPLTWRLVQLGMVFLSSLTLIYFYKILKQLKCGRTATALGVAIFAFHPTNIYFSAFLNNDNTLLFFFVMTFYFLIRWLQEHSTQNVIWLAIITSLATLTKKSAFVLLPIIFLAVLVTWFKDRPHLKLYLKQAGIFLLIAVPGIVIYPLRNFHLFKQGLRYAPAMALDLSNRLSILFGFNITSLVQNPFTYAEIEFGKHTGGFIDYLIRSSLFGEWQFPGREAGILLIIVALMNLVNLILLIGHYYLSKNRTTGKYDFIFWLNLILLCGMVFKARLDSPAVCSQNFRYMAPLLISVSYLWGQSVQQLEDLRRMRWWRYVSISLAAAFCIASAIFILMIGIS